MLKLFPITEIYSGALFWPVERAREVLQAWREWTDDGSRRGHLLRSHPPLPAAARDSRADARQLVRRRRDRVPRRRGRGRGADRAAGRAGPGDDHGRDDPDHAVWPSCTWTRRSRCPALATGWCSQSCRPRRSTRSSTSPAPIRARLCCRPRSATSAAPAVAADDSHGVLGSIDHEYLVLRGRHGHGRADGQGRRGVAGPASRRAVAVGLAAASTRTSPSGRPMIRRRSSRRRRSRACSRCARPTTPTASSTPTTRSSRRRERRRLGAGHRRQPRARSRDREAARREGLPRDPDRARRRQGEGGGRGGRRRDRRRGHAAGARRLRPVEHRGGRQGGRRADRPSRRARQQRRHRRRLGRRRAPIPTSTRSRRRSRPTSTAPTG